MSARYKYNATLVHVAAENGQLEMVKMLHQNGLPLDTKDKKGYTPADRAEKAKQEHYLEVLSFLRDPGSSESSQVSNFNKECCQASFLFQLVCAKVLKLSRSFNR